MRLRLLLLLFFAAAADALNGFDGFDFGGSFGGMPRGAAGAGAGRDTEYYDTLGLAPDCSQSEIKKAYRRMALKEHPDKGGDPEKFKAVNEAYAVLSDEQKRAAYDRMGKAAVDGSAPQGGGFAGGFPGGFGGRAGMGGMGGMSPEDILGQMFGQAFGMGGSPFGAARQPRMRDVQMTMPVALEELYVGATKKIAVRRPYITSGGAVREERVEVDIPLRPGARDGERFRIPGGSPSHANVIVVLKTKPHARFVREGDDLLCGFEVTLLEALTGFRSSVRHLDGKTLNVACDDTVTRPGQLRRLRGWGMPRRKAAGKGDLLLRFAVRFPRDPLAGEASRYLPPHARTLTHPPPERAPSPPSASLPPHSPD
jgi:DnaJ-class molecular chaperone